MNTRIACFSCCIAILTASACTTDTGPDGAVGPVRESLLQASPASESFCPTPQELSASYRFDSSADRGRVDVEWNSPSNVPASITVDIEGAAPETTKLPAGQTQYLSGTRVQDTNANDGEIQVSVTLELDCGASVRRDFSFVDPLLLCPSPEPGNIAGNEAPFYECADLWVNQGEGCGANGYLLGYGAKYAKRFYNWTRPRMTSWGRPFIDGTLVCLQSELQSEISVASSCNEILSVAFGQHPGCYVENGFCEIGPWNATQVARTPDGSDTLSKDGREQIEDILEQCGRRHIGFFF